MLRSYIYNTLILNLTSKWYLAVLERIPAHSNILDVGIGTAGALLASADVVREKKLQITGIDIDADYIEQARKALQNHPLSGQVTVHLQSVYEHQDGPYDAVYFSGSFMLLPNPTEALHHVCTVLKPGGQIYFTQTVRKQAAPWLEKIKPFLKRITTIDFGRVTYENELKSQIEAAGLELVEFTTLGSRSRSRIHRKDIFVLATARYPDSVLTDHDIQRSF